MERFLLDIVRSSPAPTDSDVHLLVKNWDQHGKAHMDSCESQEIHKVMLASAKLADRVKNIRGDIFGCVNGAGNGNED